jgi:membrane protein YqaA with SNARE-associated domain
MEGLLDPTLWITVLIISLLGVVAKLAYYNVGKRGEDSVLEHIPRITPERWDSLATSYAKRGSVMLLLASIPIAGSAITVAAGAFETRVGIFVILVLISNLIRNWFLMFVLG